MTPLPLSGEQVNTLRENLEGYRRQLELGTVPFKQRVKLRELIWRCERLLQENAGKDRPLRAAGLQEVAQ